MLHANLVSVFLQMQNSAAQELRASTPQASQAFAQLSVGQALTATIVSRLADGLYLADIQGNPIQLALPANRVSGDIVSLRVLRTEPDYVFALLPRTGSATGPGAERRPSTAFSQGAQIIQLALGDVRAPLPAALAAQAPLLASAPAASAPAAGAPAAGAPASGAPAPPGFSTLGPGSSALLPQVTALQTAAVGSTPARQLAAAFRDTIANSGLFYESHLSDWVHGRRTLAELRREPQAALNGTRPVPAGAPNPDYPLPGNGDAAARGAATAPEARPDPARSVAAGVPEEARPILRQQLETLETRQFAWQGLVWPGQQAALSIAEDPASRADGQATPTWRTMLDLSLPQLGAIHADLVATGEMLSIRVAASAADSARMLRSGLPALDQLLRAAGLRPQSITVAHDA